MDAKLIGWEVRRPGKLTQTGLTRASARKLVEEVAGDAEVFHRGRPVDVFSATFGGKRHFVLTGPDGEVWYRDA